MPRWRHAASSSFWGPSRCPGDDVGAIEQLEAGTFGGSHLALPMRQHHPRILEQPDQLDPIVGLLVDHQRQVEPALREPVHDPRVIVGLAEHDFDSGPLLSQQL
jgi:hypothetical protein